MAEEDGNKKNKELPLISGGTPKDYDRLYHFVEAVNKLAVDQATREKISNLSPEAEELVSRIKTGAVSSRVMVQIVSKYWKELGLESAVSEDDCYKMWKYGVSISADGKFPQTDDVDNAYNKYEEENFKSKKDAETKKSENEKKLKEARKARKRFRVFGNVLTVLGSAALTLAIPVASIGLLASVVFAPIPVGLMTGLGITTIVGSSLLFKYALPKAFKLFKDRIDAVKNARKARKDERKAVKEAKNELKKSNANLKGISDLLEKDQAYRSEHKYPGFKKEEGKEEWMIETENVIPKEYGPFMEFKGFTSDQVKVFEAFEATTPGGSEKEFEEYCKTNNIPYDDFKGKYAQFVSARNEFKKTNNLVDIKEATATGENKDQKTPNTGIQTPGASTQGTTTQQTTQQQTTEPKTIKLEDGWSYFGFVDENGNPHGKGQQEKDNMVIRGSFEHNTREGYFETLKDKKLVETGFYVNGERQPEITLDNGHKYMGQVNKNKKPEGKGTFILENGRCEGSFKDGECNGELVYFGKDETIIGKENYIDGKLHGESIDYWSDGKIRAKRNYNNGALHGQSVKIDENGNQTTTYYYENKDVGTKEEFDRLTKEAEAESINSETEQHVNDNHEEKTNKNGRKTIEYENGNVYVGEVNDKDEPHGKGEFTTNDGNIKISGNFTNGKQNGQFVAFTKDGKLYRKIEEVNYVDGKRNGESFKYREDGTIKSKANYVDDKLHGPYFEDENGELKITTYYFEGQDVKTKYEFDRRTNGVKNAEKVDATVEDVQETDEKQVFLPINNKDKKLEEQVDETKTTEVTGESTNKNQAEENQTNIEKVEEQSAENEDVVDENKKQETKSKLEPQAGGAGNIIPPTPPTDDNDKEPVNVAEQNNIQVNLENASEKRPNKCWLAMQCFDAIGGEPTKEQIEAIRKKTGFASLEDAKKAYAKTKKISVEEINLDPAEGKTPNRPWLAKTIGEVVGKENLSENFKKRTGYDDPDKAKIEYAKQKFVKATKETLAIAGRNGWKTFTAKSRDDVAQMFEKLEQNKKSNIVSSLKGLSKEQVAVILEGMPEGLKLFVQGQLKGKEESKPQESKNAPEIKKSDIFKKFNTNRKTSRELHFTDPLTRDEFVNYLVQEGLVENGANQEKVKDIWKEYQQYEVESATIDGEKAPEVEYSDDGTAVYAGDVDAEDVLKNCPENPTKEQYVETAKEQGMTQVEAEISYHTVAEAKIEDKEEQEKTTTEEKQETVVETETHVEPKEQKVEVVEEVVQTEIPKAEMPKVEVEIVQDKVQADEPKTPEQIEEENRIASEDSIRKFLNQYEKNISDENESLFRDYAERNGLSPEEIDRAVEIYFKQEENEEKVDETKTTEVKDESNNKNQAEETETNIKKVEEQSVENENVVGENKEQETKSTLEPKAGGAGNIIPPTPPTDDNDKESVNVADQEKVQPSQTPKDNLPEYMKTQKLIEGMEIYKEEQDFIEEFKDQVKLGKFKNNQEDFMKAAQHFKFPQERINAMINQKYGDQNKNKGNSEEGLER